MRGKATLRQAPVQPIVDRLALMSAPEVARLFGMSVQRVYELSRTRQIPSVRIGRTIRFCRIELEAFVAGGGYIPGRPVDLPVVQEQAQ